MDLVVGRRGELEAAAFARVRLLLSVVHPAVSDQLTLLSETLVAITACKRLLAWRQTENGSSWTRTNLGSLLSIRRQSWIHQLRAQIEKQKTLN